MSPTTNTADGVVAGDDDVAWLDAGAARERDPARTVGDARSIRRAGSARGVPFAR